MMASVRNRFILLVAAGYAILALAWIFLSDQLLSVFADIESIVWLSTAKGVLFVVISATGFFLCLRAVPPVENDGTQRQLLEILATSISPGRLPAWLTYSFALVVTLAMLLLRDRLAIGFGDRPLLILFMVPVTLSALLGGLGPGLVSTAVAALGVDYLAIPPEHSFRIAASHDLLQWSFLIANGILLSVLSEVLRRSLANAEMNRRLLDAVVSGTSDAVFVKDTHGRYLLANKATAGFVGKPVSEIIGRDDRSLFPDASAQALMVLDQAIMSAGHTQTHEERLTALDGKALTFLVTKGPVFDETGRTVGLFGISREITDRKQAENVIRRLNSELELRVTERTAELQSANLELEELAYALTHNLRAPVRAIGGFAQLLIDDHAGLIDDDAKACLDQINQANNAMGALIEGILALLRCTRGALQRETIDVSALANRLLDEKGTAEPQRRISREVAAGLTVFGDAALLELAIKHLIDNAWKFTRGREDALIRIFSGEVDGQQGVGIADNGVGFDMAHAERLFQPFQRLHRQDEFPGIGIGLATVQRIIKRHGGSLRAVAAPGAGATICMVLPRPPQISNGELP